MARASLTLTLAGTLVSQGAWWTGGQALPFVEMETPFAPDAEVLAETAVAGGPTFCNRARTPRVMGVPEAGRPLCRSLGSGYSVLPAAQACTLLSWAAQEGAFLFLS